MTPARRRLRLLGTGLLGLSGVALVGLGASVLWLRTDAGNDFLRARIEQALDLGLARGDARIGGLDTDLFTRWQLRDLALVDPGGRVLLAVDEATLNVRPMALLGGTLEIPELRIGGIHADLSVLEDGRLDLAALFGPPSAAEPTPWEGLPVDLLVRRLVVDPSAVEIRSPDGPLLSAAEFQLAASIAVVGTELRVDDLATQVDLAEPALGRVSLAGAAAWDGRKAALDDLVLSLGEGRVAVRGRVTELEDAPELDLTLVADPVDLVPIDALAGVGLRGRWGGELRVTGPLEQLTVAGGLEGVGEDSGTLGIDLGLDLAADDLPWTGTLTARALHVEDAVASVGEDPLVVTGVLTASGSGTQWPEGVSAGGEFVGEQVSAYGIDLDTGRARLDLTGGQLRWSEVTTAGPLGPLSVLGRYDFVDGTVSTRLTGPLPLAELARFGATDLGGTGVLDLDVDVDTSGEATRTVVRGQVRAAPFTYGEDIRFERVVVTLRSVTEGERTDVRGSFVASDGVAYSTAIKAFEEDKLVVTVDASGTIAHGTGRFSDFDIPGVGTLVGGDASWETSLPAEGSLAADVLLRPKSFRFLQNEGRTGQIAVSLREDLTHVEGFLGPRRRSNVLDFDLDFDLGTSALLARRLRFSPMPGSYLEAVEPVRLTLPPTGTGVHRTALHLRGTPGELRVLGDIATEGMLGGQVETRGLDLGFIGALLELEEPLSGALDATLELRGPAADPTLSLGDLVVKGFDGDIDITGRAEGFAHRVSLNLASELEGAPLASVHGELPVRLDLADPGLDIEGEVDLSIALRAGRLDRLARWSEGLPPGMASATVTLSGAMRDPDVEVAGVAEVDVKGWSLPARVEGAVVRRGDGLTFWMDTFQGFERLGEFNGTASTQVTQVFAWAMDDGPEPDWEDLDAFASDLDGRLLLRDVPARSLAAISGYTEDIAGVLHGEVTAVGAVSRPTVEADIRWQGGQVGSAPVDHGLLEVSRAGDRYEFVGGVTFADGGGLFSSGQLPLTLDLEAEDWTSWQTGPLEAQVGGPGLPLGVLASVDPSIADAQGRLVLEGSIEGSLSNPEPDLVASLERGRFIYAPLGLRVQGLSLRATATERLLSLKSFRAHTLPLHRNLKSGFLDILEDGPSPIRARGSMRLTDWTPGTVQGRLDLDNALLSARREQVLRISGGVEMSRQWPEVSVEGRLKVDQGYVERDAASFYSKAPLSLDPNLTILRGDSVRRGQVFASDATEEPPLYESFDVDIAFDMNRNVEADILMPFVDDLGALGASITSADVKVRLDGTGQIALTGGELGMNGEVQVISGRARVLQSNFELTDGSIAFVGDDLYNPILNLRGVMPVSGGQLDMQVAGTPELPKIDFSSEAYPDQQQVFTILLTGRSPEELSQDPGNFAAQAAGGLLLQSVLGSASLSGFSIEPDGTVSIGVPVAPSVFVRSTYAPQPELDENGVSVVAEWSIARKLVLETAWGDQESWSSLFWELRF